MVKTKYQGGQMHYSEQLAMLERVIEALNYIIRVLDEHPVTYPEAMIAYNAIRFGLIPRTTITCPHCETMMQFTSDMPVGGLDDALDCLEEAVECLVLEMQYEQPSFQYPHDYSI